MPLIFLVTTCTLCGLFLIWRRADTLRRVVSHQLKSFTRTEGRIRLSVDDGPPANEFLSDDYDEDNENLRDSADDPLSEHVRRATQAWRTPNVPLLDGGESGDADNGAVKTLPTPPAPS
ncbi:hypothetical protein NLJ89_g6787 [Agrocybe chaxingu]|uniref:Uncharacterized protein n=1 Tax=Agrocybe chaxingu TaxID=84603 RepID=A0A9W8MTR6_9AGAR|nr:hypothetical protein NLJ89_g6787 [Agrocybe chaxingu]